MFSPDAEFCLSDESRRLVLEDMAQQRAALERCNATIRVYNGTIK